MCFVEAGIPVTVLETKQEFLDKGLNAIKSNWMKRRDVSDEEILERLYYPLINEGFKILEEGIAIRPSDIDIVNIFGYGFPEYRGGPMFWAQNKIGLENLYDALVKYEKRYPNVNGDYFRPASLLKICVDRNISLEKYWAEKNQE